MKRPDVPVSFARGFFDAYLVDHFLHKQYTLYNILLGFPDLKSALLEGLEDVNDADYLNGLRVEIRATYFQAIETLFELIFSLEPREGIIDNLNVWFNLSTSKGVANYDTIEAIAGGETAFLDRKVRAAKDIEVPYVQYLFYFAITDKDALPQILTSLEPIRDILVSLAQDFKDREEYNAFKHSLRLMKFAHSFEILDHKTKRTVLSRDLSDSMTYMKGEKDGTVVLRTKPLDTERDIRMTTLCTALISNLIRSRAMHFKKGPPQKFTMFSNDTLKWAGRTDFDWLDFELRFKTIDSDIGKNP